MKTDRELLELAAKSVGLKVIRYLEGFGLAIEGEPVLWNPRDNDGQALWLAVKIGWEECQPYIEGSLAAARIDGDCEEKAVRLAITLAAAAIGESMK